MARNKAPVEVMDVASSLDHVTAAMGTYSIQRDRLREVVQTLRVTDHVLVVTDSDEGMRFYALPMEIEL